MKRGERDDVADRIVERERAAGYGPDGAWVACVALDPGKTTGVAWLRVRAAVLRDMGWLSVLKARLGLGGATWEAGTGEIDCEDLVGGVGRLTDAIAGVARVGIARAPVRVVVVVEDFSLYAGRQHVGKDALWSPRVAAGLQCLIGRVTGLLWVWQMPSERTVITDERLKRWGVYVPGDHARDALRHMIVWLRKQDWDGWR